MILFKYSEKHKSIIFFLSLKTQTLDFSNTRGNMEKSIQMEDMCLDMQPEQPYPVDASCASYDVSTNIT